MNERRASILEMVTEAYIHSARPVASAFIAEKLKVSSATVRNEFSALEDSGYLKQPHTSAGRTPTTLGYETYAHKFIPPGHLSLQQESLLNSLLEGKHGDAFLQKIADAASLLSGYAVVLSLPSDPDLKALEIHLSSLSSRRLLAVIVLENGLIRQIGLDLDPLPEEDVLREAESSLRQLEVPVRELPKGLTDIAKRAEETLARTLLALAAALPNISPPKLFSQGLRQVLSEPESHDPNFVRTLIDRFENPESYSNVSSDLVISLDEALAGVTAKLPFGPSHASLVLLGPTRMRYKDALTVAHGITLQVQGNFSLN
ncbi:MAG: HTH domain-containing protein [Trueperaceae bacterium]|nr:HTH domain-containing protein [Trueperaceae bacterium]